MKEEKELIPSEIHFELSEDKRTCKIMRGEKQVGQMWSQGEPVGGIKNKYWFPYPHEDNTYCRNSVQICGFDHGSEIWACGPFSGKKDTVLHFRPTDDEYYQRKSTEYAEYVKKFFQATTKTLHSGAGPFTITEMGQKEGNDIKQLKSFEDWLNTGGCF